MENKLPGAKVVGRQVGGLLQPCGEQSCFLDQREAELMETQG